MSTLTIAKPICRDDELPSAPGLVVMLDSFHKYISPKS